MTLKCCVRRTPEITQSSVTKISDCRGCYRYSQGAYRRNNPSFLACDVASLRCGRQWPVPRTKRAAKPARRYTRILAMLCLFRLLTRHASTLVSILLGLFCGSCSSRFRSSFICSRTLSTSLSLSVTVHSFAGLGSGPETTAPGAHVKERGAAVCP